MADDGEFLFLLSLVVDDDEAALPSPLVFPGSNELGTRVRRFMDLVPHKL